MQTRLVLCTCPDIVVAETLARRVVAEHLAACVNLVPQLRSIYRWQGEIHDDAEVLLLIKTTAARFDALRQRLLELHPYELPEIVAVNIDSGLPRYLDWIAQQTRPDTPQPTEKP